MSLSGGAIAGIVVGTLLLLLILLVAAFIAKHIYDERVPKDPEEMTYKYTDFPRPYVAYYSVPNTLKHETNALKTKMKNNFHTSKIGDKEIYNRLESEPDAAYKEYYDDLWHAQALTLHWGLVQVNSSRKEYIDMSHYHEIGIAINMTLMMNRMFDLGDRAELKNDFPLKCYIGQNYEETFKISDKIKKYFSLEGVECTGDDIKKMESIVSDTVSMLHVLSSCFHECISCTGSPASNIALGRLNQYINDITNKLLADGKQDIFQNAKINEHVKSCIAHLQESVLKQITMMESQVMNEKKEFKTRIDIDDRLKVGKNYRKSMHNIHDKTVSGNYISVKENSTSSSEENAVYLSAETMGALLEKHLPRKMCPKLYTQMTKHGIPLVMNCLEEMSRLSSIGQTAVGCGMKRIQETAAAANRMMCILSRCRAMDENEKSSVEKEAIFRTHFSKMISGTQVELAERILNSDTLAHNNLETEREAIERYRDKNKSVMYEKMKVHKCSTLLLSVSSNAMIECIMQSFLVCDSMCGYSKGRILS